MKDLKNRRPRAKKDKAGTAFAMLRSKAERQVKAEGGPEACGKGRILHELRTHQVELEMQNVELRKSEEQLLESRRKFADLYEYAPVGYLTLGETGLVLNINKTGVMLLRTRRDLVERRPLSSFIHRKDWPEFYEHLKSVFARGTKQTCEIAMKRPVGGEFAAHLESIAFEAGGPRRANALVAIIDITEKKKMEKELKQLLEERTARLKNFEDKNTELRGVMFKLSEAVKEKNALLQELNHRTKNNMNVISSLMAVQMKSIQDPGMRQIFKESQNRIQSMALVHEMLYQTKELSEIDLKSYLDRLARHLLAGYREKGIGLELDLDPVPVSLYVATPLGLIINELLSNAVKHAFPEDSKQGIVKLTLKKEGPYVRLSYEDNGIGLPKGFQIKDGSSLGLKLVDGLVINQLLGTLELDGIRRRRKGTRITVSFNKERIEGKNGQ